MAEGPPLETEIREAVGLFDDPLVMEQAVEELLTQGFDQYDISVLGSQDAVEEHLGHRLRNSQDVADDPDIPRRAFTDIEARTEGKGALASVLGYVGAVTAGGLVFATGGAAAPAIAAGLIAGGGAAALGAALGQVLDKRYLKQFREQVEKGGILVWVRVEDDRQEAIAKGVLTRHGAHGVHAHTIAP